MEFQELLALIIVGTTAALFIAASVRRRMRGPAPLCPGNCSCSAARGGDSPERVQRIESAAGKG